MEIATNNACSELQPVAPRKGKQFLLDFMAEEQFKKSKNGGRNAANSQLIVVHHSLDATQLAFWKMNR